MSGGTALLKPQNGCPPLQLLPWLAFPIAPANAAFTAVTAFAVPMTPLHSLLLNGLEGGGAGAFSSPTGGGARLAAAAAACRPILERAQNSHCPSSQHSPAANGWLAAASGPAWAWAFAKGKAAAAPAPAPAAAAAAAAASALKRLAAIGCCSLGRQPSFLLSPPHTSRCV